MGPLVVQQRLRRLRRSLAVLVLVFALGGVVAMHHGSPAMPEGHHGMDLGTVVELCLGAFSAVGAAIVAITLGLVLLGRWRPLLTMVPVGLLMAPHPPMPRARAGPAFLCVFRR